MTVVAQGNLVVNGDFSQGTVGWNDIGLYDGGQATTSVQNRSYTIDISSGGPNAWSIQFTQNNIALENSAAYTLSYDISATIDRTVEVSLSRNGGDYASYSGRDTVRVNTQRRTISRTFVMKHPNDNDVRLEFNCGRASGRVSISNVSLVRFTDRLLSVERPAAGDILYAGIPARVTWSSLNISGGIHVDLSIDNGATWQRVATAATDTGSAVFIPAMVFSPWCRLRVSSATDSSVSALSEGFFEVAPRRELIVNGVFSGTDAGWHLGLYGGGGAATGGSHNDSLYRIVIQNSADEPWQIQLTQAGIPLVKGQAYRFSFLAWASAPTSISTAIGMAHEPYKSYGDTAQWSVALGATPRLFSVVFTMNEPTDSNARLEFNCGKAAGELFLGAVSLLPEYRAPLHNNSRTFIAIRQRTSTTPALRGASFRATVREPLGTVVIDLKGRTIGSSLVSRQKASGGASPQNASGLYLYHRPHNGSPHHRGGNSTSGE
jgi:hypothetical protein